MDAMDRQACGETYIDFKIKGMFEKLEYESEIRVLN